ncbi:MAG: RnfABCDGE type electron transport complex subunit B [Lachnospira sp.]|nr:RnfABCDGE type electron transport complex subunit B [Lachnospira sp.]
MTGIILAAVVVGCVGVVLGLFLGIMGKKFAVEVDEKEVAVRAELPGNNCGGCGYAGCDGLAKAIAAGEAEVGACPVGGAPVAAKIAEIMGAEAGEAVRKTAFVKCAGDCDKAKENYKYTGVEDCSMVGIAPNGGSKACTYGCLGYGSCVNACPFDAIHIVNGIAVVDKEKCKACGKCVATCPRHLIEIIPYEATYAVACSSKDKGKDVMAVCSTGCIGCGICAKQCEFGAIVVENNVAHIDQEKCTGCGKCAEKCPKKIIQKQN